MANTVETKSICYITHVDCQENYNNKVDESTITYSSTMQTEVEGGVYVMEALTAKLKWKGNA